MINILVTIATVLRTNLSFPFNLRWLLGCLSTRDRKSTKTFAWRSYWLLVVVMRGMPSLSSSSSQFNLLSCILWEVRVQAFDVLLPFYKPLSVFCLGLCWWSCMFPRGEFLLCSPGRTVVSTVLSSDENIHPPLQLADCLHRLFVVSSCERSSWINQTMFTKAWEK